MSAADDPRPDGGDAEDGSREPQPCMPCNGSGQVVSNLGGAQSKVTCPWCGGGGVRVPGADAQEYRREQEQRRPR